MGRRAGGEEPDDPSAWYEKSYGVPGSIGKFGKPTATRSRGSAARKGDSGLGPASSWG
jgi:hypothetical protein